MALNLDDVLEVELEEIRKRRLHQWQVERARRGALRAAGNGQERTPCEPDLPPTSFRDRIIDGVPLAAVPKGDGAETPLVFNRALEDLERSRKTFLKRQKNRAARHAKHQSGNGSADADTDADDHAISGTTDGLPKNAHYGLVGLALSGGGVRSSTFCLGAIQALEKWGVFSKIDYLSTVSGGGFIGSCLSSLYSDGSTKFPFYHERGVPEGQPMRHLRNYANYLAPRGLVDYLKAPGLLLRGILVNFLIILPYVLLAAISTAVLYGPLVREAIQVTTGQGKGPLTQVEAERWADAGREVILSGSFTFAGWFVVLFLSSLVVFPIAQSLGTVMGWSNWERRNRGNAMLAFGMMLTLCVAAIEAQPIVVYYSAMLWSNPWFKNEIFTLDVWTGIFSVLAGLGATVSGKLAPKTNQLAAKLALLGIGLLGPLVLWLVYLMLTRWAICGPPDWTNRIAGLVGYEPWPVSGRLCFSIPFGANPEKMTWTVVSVLAMVAGIIWLYGFFFINANRNSLHAFYRDRLSRAYLFKRVQPEHGDMHNSKPAASQIIHNDRQALEDLRTKRIERSLADRLKAIPKDLREITWRTLWSLLGTPRRASDEGKYIAPYHLINATINVRRPRTNLVEEGDTPEDGTENGLDLHGRKADFFLFSPHFIGSKVTSYCRTEDMHSVDRHVDLGTAMAISGAAAAPNMGTSTVRPLVFILTLLNVRLGYWLPNPRAVHQRFHPESGLAVSPSPAKLFHRIRERLNKSLKKILYVARLSYRVGPMYLLFEMFGLLNQEWPFINVSDGGHIENLGLYPLLQRRCRRILLIDGVWDPATDDGSTLASTAISN